MREILFRGKTKMGEWLEGSLMKYTDETPTKREEHFRIQETLYGFTDESNTPFFCDYTSGFDEEVIPETIGQYTGLKDKNGKKIFEGDIHCHQERYYVVRFGKHADTFYSGDRYGWYLEEIGGNRVESFDGFEYLFVNIVGNIHDNPELLED
jgi:uncharacterized phage protein (TIGR01671 family)